MSIGTIDRTPPPFFRQGPSALTKLVLCSALALFLMVADSRFTIIKQLRAVVATALYYPQQVLLVPVQAVIDVGEYAARLTSQARGAAFGSAATTGGGMEMRFMAGNADVQVGDLLGTSGVDGVYPAGLPVAKVVSVDRKSDAGFARIMLTPVSHPDGVRHVLVLEPVGAQMPARPELPAEEGKATAPKRGGSRK